MFKWPQLVSDVVALMCNCVELDSCCVCTLWEESCCPAEQGQIKTDFAGIRGQKWRIKENIRAYIWSPCNAGLTAVSRFASSIKSLLMVYAKPSLCVAINILTTVSNTCSPLYDCFTETSIPLYTINGILNNNVSTSRAHKEMYTLNSTLHTITNAHSRMFPSYIYFQLVAMANIWSFRNTLVTIIFQIYYATVVLLNVYFQLANSRKENDSYHERLK